VHEDLFPYYENELSYLRKSGAEFARKYPTAASALLLDKDQCLDPHVERMLEAFAFLTARIRRKLDDELPEVSESLLDMLYPHYLTPVPTMGIAQFQIDPQSAKLTSIYNIPKNTVLQSLPVEGDICRFRTCYPVDLAPVAIDAVKISPLDKPVITGPQGRKAQAVLAIRLKALSGLTFGEFSLETLRIFLSGGSAKPYRLYEIIGNHTTAIEVVSGSNLTGSERGLTLSADNIEVVGFTGQDALLPFPDYSFDGYRLIQEFFVFPQKFLFYDIHLRNSLSRFKTDKYAVIKLFLSKVPSDYESYSAENISLGCTPVVNLFTSTAVPVQVDPARSQYPVLPEQTSAEADIFSVDKVQAVSAKSSRVLEPFYTFAHSLNPETNDYWFTNKESEPGGKHKFQINLCKLSYQDTVPDAESLSIQITCSNRKAEKIIPSPPGKTDFTVERIATFGPIKLLLKSNSTTTQLGRDDEYWSTSSDRRYWRGGQWRLISHLALNRTGLQKGGIDVLHAILQLYDIKGAPEHENIILGLKNINTKPVDRLIKGALCRGLSIELTVDQERFKESSYYLMTAILERYFSLYASINSFVQLTVIDNSDKRTILKQWPIRIGEQSIL
jgi:type VI secretion system protein ImpG